MDGIFGIGLAEIIIIVLVIVVVGGPQNAIKWSRGLGHLLRQGRDLFAQLMREFDKEMGEEGREIMKATREFGQNLNDVRQQANPKRLIGEAGKKLIEDPYEETKRSLQAADKKANSSAQKPGKADYSAWVPQDDPADAPKRYDAWLPADRSEEQ